MSTEKTTDILAVLATLVEFETTSRESNLGLIEWVRDYLGGHGVDAQLIYDRNQSKANLFATIGPAVDGGIILSGHTDVVPAADQQWDSHPFRASIRDNKLYGRGASDMKGFLACVLEQVPSWKNQPLRRPIHLAFSYDEEIGCVGVHSLISHMETTGLRVLGCVVGEPTSMEPVVAHKGRICGHCTVQGKSVHSSLAPQGVNAIAFAARMIVFIESLADREIRSGHREPGFDVPFSTIATTLVQGGCADNIIPNKCNFSFDYRYLPGVDPARIFDPILEFKDRLVAEMRLLDAEANIGLHRDESCLPLNADEHSPIAALVKALARNTSTRKVAFSTEAGYFERQGIAAIVCGPGSIEQAHRANEYVDIDQLIACRHFLNKLGVSLCDR